jgi:hypothetical protein
VSLIDGVRVKRSLDHGLTSPFDLETVLVYVRHHQCSYNRNVLYDNGARPVDYVPELR